MVDEENGEDILIAEDADQMATKLDLARAYIDMGDSEGARVILEEVAESGTTEQPAGSRRSAVADWLTPKTHPFSTNALPTGQRIALRVEYLGTGFSGWQAQPQLPQLQTVQTEVERALGKVANCSIRVHCAGRTDTGVHGIAQWVHFDAPVARSLKAWVVGGNRPAPGERAARGCACCS
jgi:FimV-like protein